MVANTHSVENDGWCHGLRHETPWRYGHETVGSSEIGDVGECVIVAGPFADLLCGETAGGIIYVIGLCAVVETEDGC